MSAFRDVLGRPNVLATVTWSFVGRLPTAAAPLALLMLLHSKLHGLERGGFAVGLYAIGVAAGQPPLARLADRRGQGVALLASSALSCAAFLALLWAPSSVAFVLVCAAVAGVATPPLEPCLRALWPVLVRGPDELRTAFAADAALIELLYVIGPLATVAFVSLLGPGGGVLFCAVSGVGGAGLFAATRVSRSAVRFPRAAGGVSERLFTSGYLRLLSMLVATGLPVGALSILVVGYADAHHQNGIAGLALSANAGGALLGAWLATRVGQFSTRSAVVLLAVGYLPLALPLPPAGWLAACALAGVMLPRVLTASFADAQTISPEARLTEANAWIITAFGCGAAAAAAGAGVVAAAFAPARPITILGCAALCLASAVAAGASTRDLQLVSEG